MRVGEGTSRLFKRIACGRDSSEGVSQTLQLCVCAGVGKGRVVGEESRIFWCQGLGFVF